ncbi:uncharacterized protein LOC123721390 [Papilio machaon]|uniref:uncharacterized protein LOC123721390 n=1 Tax=Papilio machaon TaxID=76193 RepID=UPI001E662E4B|nr:uncharacterized protein LOC123721390 [Papilio machaon]
MPSSSSVALPINHSSSSIAFAKENNIVLSSNAPIQFTTSTHVLLSTAMVKVIDDNGNSMDARLLLDNGSTANFITQSLCSKLKLSTRSVTNMKVEHLQRYQRINYIKQHFWKRFSKEYVSLLQTKTKWFHSTGQLSVGTLVLLKEAGQPPLLWPLGRVTKIYPGVDGGSRVAELKMKGKTVLRSYKNICPLPLD